MPPKKNTKRAKAPSALDRRGKKKVSILTQEKIEYVDWKDVNLLRGLLLTVQRSAHEGLPAIALNNKEMLLWPLKTQEKWHYYHTKTESQLNEAVAAVTVDNETMTVDQGKPMLQNKLNKQLQHLKLKKLLRKLTMRSQQNESRTSN